MLHSLREYLLLSLPGAFQLFATDQACPSDYAAKKFPWKSWVSIAIKRKLRIVNWLATILAPGPDFNYHTVEADEIKILLGNFIGTLHEGRNVKDSNIPRIKCWTPGIYL